MTPENQNIATVTEDQESSIDWVELISVLCASRKLIAIVTGIATIGAVIISLLLPEYYKSTATLLPEYYKSSATHLPETEKSKLAALGGISDLAAHAGVSVGGDGSLAKPYPTIIKSEAVLRNVIYAEYQTKKLKEPVNLIKFWEMEEATPERSYETVLKTLRQQLEVSLDIKTSVVTVSIETTEPQLSADIINRVLLELDEFIRTKRITSASEQRKWIEHRLEQVKEDLEKSENKLKEFREKNRRIGDSPQLLLEHGRLMREVEINSTLYEELKKQYEIAKIEEIKNIPIINVMDQARPAVRKERPKRSIIVLGTLVGTFLGTVFYQMARYRYGSLFLRAQNGSKSRNVKATTYMRIFPRLAPSFAALSFSVKQCS